MAEDTVNEDTDAVVEEQQDDSSVSEDVTPPADETMLADDAADTDEADSAEDTDGDDADGDGEAEPADYDDISIPDGVEADMVALGEFKEIAANMNDGKGLSIEDAQALVDFRAKMAKESVGEWETKFSEWRGELMSDPDIGGDSFKTDTVPNVLAAAERYGDKEMLALLQTNKMYGENPSLIRMLNRVGETLRADQHVRGRAAGPNTEETRLRRMYPSHYNEEGLLKEATTGSKS